MLWVPKRTVSMTPFEHPKHMLKLIGKKIFTILRSKIFFISKPLTSAHILLNLLNKSNVRLNNIVAQMGLVARKPVFGVSDKASFKSVSSAAETS